jgi:hypothetical protein
MAEDGVLGGRSQAHWRRHQNCGIRLARGDAGLQTSWQRAVRGAKQFGTKPNRTGTVLYRQGKPHGFIARIHQENAADTGERPGTGEAQ